MLAGKQSSSLRPRPGPQPAYRFSSRVPKALVHAQPVDALLLNKKLEAKAKALIDLEEQDAAQRPKVRVSVQHKLALGDTWKVVGRVPELGRFVPEVAPTMKWGNGDVWSYEGRIRPGRWTYKLVLRKADGAYVWEEGPDRVLEVPRSLGPDDTLDVEVTQVQLPN